MKTFLESLAQGKLGIPVQSIVHALRHGDIADGIVIGPTDEVPLALQRNQWPQK